MTSLQITPGTTDIWLKPGATFTQTYQVKNTGNLPLTLSTSVERWMPQGNDGEVKYSHLPLGLSFSLSNANLELGDTFILAPQETKLLVLKGQGPSSAQPQDLYFTFFINQSAELTSAATTSLARLGSHLLVSLSHSENPQLSATLNLQVQNYFHDTFFFPLTFSGLINNQSDFFFKSEGTLTITKNNTTIKQLSIFPHNVLAHHQRTLSCLDHDDLVPCQLNPPLWPGIYQATLSLNQPQTTTQTTFFVFPYSLLIATLLLFILFQLPKYIKKHLANK